MTAADAQVGDADVSGRPWEDQGEDQSGSCRGFPGAERAVRGAPEALRVLCGKSCRRG